MLNLMIAGCSRPAEKTAVVRQTERPRELFELKVKCAELGRRYMSEHIQGTRANGWFPLHSRFAYNSNLNTCIFRGGSIITGSSNHFIVDLITNEELAGYFGDGPKDKDGEADRVKFEKRELELFGPNLGVSAESKRASR